MQLPTIENYGNYSSDNYGVNSLKVTMGDLQLWYSYETIVAFACSHFRDKFDNCPLVVTKNTWGNTTGKHLNWIDGGRKEARIDREDFEKYLAQALQSHGVEK